MKKECIELIDAYQDFLNYWTIASSKNLNSQVRLWQTPYMSKYSELLEKQIKCCKTENIDWHEIAEKVFSALPDRLKLIQKARDNILAFYRLICTRALQKLGTDFNILLVDYVGIGCGAGWATKYNGQPAVLLGLENVAEEKWHTRNKRAHFISELLKTYSLKETALLKLEDIKKYALHYLNAISVK